MGLDIRDGNASQLTLSIRRVTARSVEFDGHGGPAQLIAGEPRDPMTPTVVPPSVSVIANTPLSHETAVQSSTECRLPRRLNAFVDAIAMQS